MYSKLEAWILLINIQNISLILFWSFFTTSEVLPENDSGIYSHMQKKEWIINFQHRASKQASKVHDVANFD